MEGQVTYHGPGQIVIYTLFDLRRLGIGVRTMVVHLENTIIALLRHYAIEASGRRDAPGVYVNGAKIAALGLRVRRACTYHGLSLNVAMDLQPFTGINPCGYRGLPVTQMSEYGVTYPIERIAEQLIDCLAGEFGYNLPVSYSTQWPKDIMESL